MIIGLGDKVKDYVTGLIGVAVSKIVYLNGCIQYGVKGKASEGKAPDVEYIDKDQLQVLKKNYLDAEKETVPPGGDMPDKPKK